MDTSDSLAGCSICLNQGQGGHCDVGLNYNVAEESGDNYQYNQGGQSQQGICVTARETNSQTICRDISGGDSGATPCACGATTDTSKLCTPAAGIPHCLVMESGDSRCRASCPSGKFRSTETLDAICVTCSTPGYFCPEGGTTSPTQFACPPGEYSDEPGTTAACKKCLAGKWNNKEHLGFDCFACPAGYSQPAEGRTNCAICIPGTFQNETIGSTACRECPQGQYQQQSGSPFCIPCNAGTYQADTKQTLCNNCPANWFSNQGSQSQCEECASSEMSPEGQTFCSKCEAGTFLEDDGDRLCHGCPGGYVSSYGTTACDLCEAGYFSIGTNQTSCDPCDKGKYSSEQGAASIDTCLKCPKGTYSSAKGVHTIDDCNSCTPGKFSVLPGNSKSCTDCPFGWLQEKEGQDHCKKPDATFIVGVGGASQQQVAEGWVKSDATKSCSAIVPSLVTRVPSVLRLETCATNVHRGRRLQRVQQTAGAATRENLPASTDQKFAILATEPQENILTWRVPPNAKCVLTERTRLVGSSASTK